MLNEVNNDKQKYNRDQSRLCFYVLVRYSVVLFVELWKLY